VSRRIVIRNAITGEKIRCGEALAPHLALLTSEAATVMHDANASVSVTVPVALTMPTTWGASVLTSSSRRRSSRCRTGFGA
jgi:hypothetical protein